MAPRADDLPTLPQGPGPGGAEPSGATPGATPQDGERPTHERTSVPTELPSGKRQRTLGRYRLLFRLARGGMGSVFAAILEGQRGVDRTVAIKLLNSQDQSADEVDAFVQEAKLTARITHPNVLDTFELGMEGGEPFLVMPLVRGVSLARLMKAGEPLDPALAAWIAMQIAAGLHAAHELKEEDGTPLGVIHRDVSPQNVLLSYEGRVLLVDFGVAKLFEGARATASGVIKGKFGYMAPEQLRGEPLDRRSDVFALGIVLFEMLTGRPLYAALPPAQATFRIATDPVPKAREVLSSIPKELDDVIASCLAKDRSDRFETALEIRDALRAFLRARGATVDEADLAAHLGSRFAKERADLEERIRAALAERAAPDVASADRPRVSPGQSSTIEEGAELPSQASRVVLTSSAMPPPMRDRSAWPLLGLGAGAIAVVALVLGMREPSQDARSTPSGHTAPAAPPSAAPPEAAQPPAATTEPSSIPAAASAPFPSPAPSTSATSSGATKPPAAKPTASAAPAPAASPPPAKSTDPRGVPFRDL